MSITGQDVLSAVRRMEACLNDEPEGLGEKPIVILAHRNIDLEQVEELWSGYLNDMWADKIKEKIAEGFVPFRIQTEWDSAGHHTKIYLVKMKPGADS